MGVVLSSATHKACAAQLSHWHASRAQAATVLCLCRKIFPWTPKEPCEWDVCACQEPFWLVPFITGGVFLQDPSSL